ncbi:DNA adenine methylase [Mesorhizobium sp.]|uniref:DNA adenine methylase n=1 Tax=Mesorhizobium sp. TaxID=1871066 RepID=UPI003568BF6D
MGGEVANKAEQRLVTSFGPATSCANPSTLKLIQPVAASIAGFPSTRYYGSKRKLLPWIYSHLGPIRFESVLDAFGGTASVSLMFKAMRKSVTYHDGLRFNEDVGRAVLRDKPVLSRDAVENLLGKVEPRHGTIAEQFSNVFFKDDENAWLDGFFSIFERDFLSAEDRSLLRYIIYQACLKKRPFNLFHRANIHLRNNTQVSRSFGNASTWERSFSHHAMQAYDELAKFCSPWSSSCSILPSGNAEDIAPGYDLVYIDPPYISKEERKNRDDYWRRYHFLEGLARYSEWEDLIDRKSDIRLFPPPSWLTDWSRARSFKERLFSLIDTHRNSIVVLSYVSDALPSETEIKAHFEDRFSQFSIHSCEYSSALSKMRKRELLFIGHPRT